MAKQFSAFKSNKRKKELQRKKKQEEKRKRRFNKKNDQQQDTEFEASGVQDADTQDGAATETTESTED